MQELERTPYRLFKVPASDRLFYISVGPDDQSAQRRTINTRIFSGSGYTLDEISASIDSTGADKVMFTLGNEALFIWGSRASLVENDDLRPTGCELEYLDLSGFRFTEGLLDVTITPVEI